MPLLKISEFEAGPAKSGVSMGRGESKGRAFFRVGLTEFAQNDLFGRIIDVEKEALKLVVNNDPKTRHLMGIGVVLRDDPAAIRLVSGVRASVSCKVQPWNGSGESKGRSMPLDVVNRHVGEDLISVKLPEFAKPPAAQGMAVRR